MRALVEGLLQNPDRVAPRLATGATHRVELITRLLLLFVGIAVLARARTTHWGRDVVRQAPPVDEDEAAAIAYLAELEGQA